VICSSCGAANDPGQKFCGDRGARMLIACPACGASVAPGRRFGGGCGASVAGPTGAGSGARPTPVTSAPWPVAERRLVSILFADLVGFTMLAEGRDSEEVRELLTRSFDLCGDIITRYGGTVEKFIGDAVMAVWGAPTAREDDTERSVRAALDLVDAVRTLGLGISARAGVLTGEMVRGRCGLLETDDAATTRSKVASTLAEHIGDEAERRWIEPALLALLGVATGMGSEQLFGAWRTFFERFAATAPVVMVFEDHHHADTGLLDFVDHLLEWSRNVPIHVVTLSRPELLERRPDWGAGKRNFNSLYLEPLSESAMRALLAGLVPGLPEGAIKAIVSRADGMPLYAVETVRMLVAQGRLAVQDGIYRPVGDLTTLAVPETLTALIASRLDGLAPDDRALVFDAAVLGQSFTIAGLSAVSGIEPSTLEPRLRALVRRELLTLEADPRSPELGQYAFVQALIVPCSWKAGAWVSADGHSWPSRTPSRPASGPATGTGACPSSASCSLATSSGRTGPRCSRPSSASGVGAARTSTPLSTRSMTSQADRRPLRRSMTQRSRAPITRSRWVSSNARPRRTAERRR